MAYPPRRGCAPVQPLVARGAATTDAIVRPALTLRIAALRRDFRLLRRTHMGVQRLAGLLQTHLHFCGAVAPDVARPRARVCRPDSPRCLPSPQEAAASL